MTEQDIAALVAALPSAIRAAVEQQDEAVFQQVFQSLDEAEQLRVAQVFQQLQGQMAHNILDEYDEENMPSADELIASLPPAVAQALMNEDPEGLQTAYDALPLNEQERVGRTMMLIQALADRMQGQDFDDGFSTDGQDIITAFDPLLQAIAAVALGDDQPRADIEATLPQLEANGWRLVEPVQRIWAGERDEMVLMAGLDESDATLISYVLELITQNE
ncbi:MAG: hypothetical protein H0T53_04300 [Herpetosiphonaceae bacterium]|nr:hypothetical protein [Herpetosiphonaceae bacterium]